MRISSFIIIFAVVIKRGCLVKTRHSTLFCLIVINSRMVRLKILRGFVGFAFLSCVSSCDSVFDVHPYDVRVKGQTALNSKQIVRIENLTYGKDTIRLAFISDTHQWLSDFSDEVADINRRDSIDFVIHGGDLTDFGSTREFEWTREKLLKLGIPFVALLGNHDCLGTGEQAYQEMFGNPDFSFIAGRIKFVCLNTNAMEFDYSRPVPNFDYMESQVTENSQDYDRTVICMHAAPYSEQFNNNVAKVFNYYTQNFPNLLFCLYGHGHHTEQHDLFENGIMYYQVGNAPKRQYYLFTITPTDYKYEIIDF